MRHGRLLFYFVTGFLSLSLCAKEIVVGVETIPERRAAILFTPVVIPDLFSAKAAFEYRLSHKLNLVIPLEAKWMNYRWAIRLFASDAYPEELYRRKNGATLGWNIDFLQFKMSSGLGLKFLPFSESMWSAFYVKALLMAGAEHFFDYREQSPKDSAVFTLVWTMGYSWVLGNHFMMGGEVGQEYIYHADPIKDLPQLFIAGFNPLMLQLNLGFTF